jgi:hypothetical protein
LDEVSGPRLDSSGWGNHLSDNNSVGVGSGQMGLAADLERDNGEYLSISEAAQQGLDITGSLTLVGWLNYESLDVVNWQVLAGKYELDVNNRAYRLDMRASDLLTFIVSPNGSFDSGYRLDAQLANGMVPGVWYHVAGVFDAAQRMLLVYVNGQLIAWRTVSYDTIYNSPAPFMLGANVGSGSVIQHFDGRLDDWRVYNRALSQAEIAALMAP